MFGTLGREMSTSFFQPSAERQEEAWSKAVLAVKKKKRSR
jgi:hypothetical protein